MSVDRSVDVAVVGAGLAGLAAALRLHEAGRSVQVFERSDGPGGRVRTDVVDGFRLDRGFQILLSAYPDAQRLLRYDQLDLQAFDPGARVRVGTEFHTVGDPFRRPRDIVATARAPIGSLADKLRILRYRQRVKGLSAPAIWAQEDTTARAHLRAQGFSDRIVDRFFGPLFAGITLDPSLSGSSNVVDFVFQMLSRGDAVVPANGMGEIPADLVDRLPADAVRYESPVATVLGDGVTLESGDVVDAGAVIVATGMTDAAELAGTPDRGWHGVTSFWFSAAEPIDGGPVLTLNGTGIGPVNTVANMSAVSSAYAPSGQHLVVASSVAATRNETGAAEAMRAQLREWYGGAVDDWRVLRVDRVDAAQPAQAPGQSHGGVIVTDGGVIVTGDHRADASINGALRAGVEASAEALRHLG